MLRYYVIDVYSSINNITIIAQSNYNLLRWLLRRGSPLPIPNRVVKPACADGTAVMWESMSSPFFENPVLMNGVFCFYRNDVFGFLPRFVAFLSSELVSDSIKSSSFIWWGFFVRYGHVSFYRKAFYELSCEFIRICSFIGVDIFFKFVRLKKIVVLILYFFAIDGI